MNRSIFTVAIVCFFYIAGTQAYYPTRYAPREYASLLTLKKDRRKHTSWGIHTMITLTDCAHYAIRSTWDMERFTQRVCSFIGVSPIGKPSVVYHYAGYGYSSGYTVMQHANGHTDIVIRVDEDENNVYLDIFSCKYYDAHALVNRAQDFFNAYEATVDIIYRK